MPVPAYTIHPDVLKRAQALGFAGDSAEATLQDMARRAVRLTHPVANRRFRDFILFVTPQNVVTRLEKLDPREAAYLTRRTYDERKAETDPGEATVERVGRFRK